MNLWMSQPTKGGIRIFPMSPPPASFSRRANGKAIACWANTSPVAFLSDMNPPQRRKVRTGPQVPGVLKVRLFRSRMDGGALPCRPGKRHALQTCLQLLCLAALALALGCRHNGPGTADASGRLPEDFPEIAGN